MKITSLSGTPITGTRRGIVYTAPGDTNLGRARVVPLQPRSNNQNSVALSVAAAAQFWKLIPSIDRDAWAAWYGGAVPGYNAFVKINSNAFTWGSSNLIETPYTVHTPGVIFATLFAEPDGIHTTLAVVTNAAPTPPDECWVRLYINFQQRTLTQRHPAARAVYFGSFQATAANGINLYDVTDLMTQNAGQWWYPSCVDTASKRGCGNVCYANYYVTDRFGMPGGAVLQYPTLDQFAGIEPGQLGPGVCPILTTPPFPWPTAAVFYGVPPEMKQRFFTTPGAATYTPTPGTLAVIIELVGAGGGGSGVDNPPSARVNLGGGGGAGAYLSKQLAANFSGATFFVGSGGAGGAAGNHSGGGGTATTFTTSGGSPTTYTAGGGSGGNPSGDVPAPAYIGPTPGGTASGGDINIPGGNSLAGGAATTNQIYSGANAASHLSPGAEPAFVFTSGTSAPGIDSPGFGGGGSGAISGASAVARAGGAGAQGIVIVTELF